MERMKFALSVLLLFIGACFPLFGTNATYSFSGVASDGRAVTFGFTVPAPISSSTLLGAAQVSCAPACDAVGMFPNALAGYDLAVFDLRNPGLISIPLGFLAVILGSLLYRDKRAEEMRDELYVRTNTGILASKAAAH